MLSDILRINESLNITVLYVTNNYEEAISLKKHIIFMKEGRIINEQKPG